MGDITTFQFFIYSFIAIEAIAFLYVLGRVVKGKSAFSDDQFFLAPMVAAAGIGAITGAAQLGIGIAQKAKAARLARQNKRPVLGDNTYTEEAYNLAGSLAGTGLSDSAMQAYNTQNDRSLGSSINAVLKSGGSANNIADLYNGAQNGIRELALADQQQQNVNYQQYLRAVQAKADQERDQWYLNKYVPFQDTAALSSQMSSQGMDNMWKGANTLGGAAMNFAGSGAPGAGVMGNAGQVLRQTTNASANIPGAVRTAPAAQPYPYSDDPSLTSDMLGYGNNIRPSALNPQMFNRVNGVDVPNSMTPYRELYNGARYMTSSPSGPSAKWNPAKQRWE